jgi:acetyltransferase-like isoleucine patch superfamily enzyme
MEETAFDIYRHSTVELALGVGRRAISAGRKRADWAADAIPAPWYRATHPGLAVGRGSKIGRGVRFRGAKGIRLGADVAVGMYVSFDAEGWGGGSIDVGDRVEIHDFARVATYGGQVRIGNDCSVNAFCVLHGHGGLTIGNMVRIAPFVMMIPANHGTVLNGVPMMLQAETRNGISIGDDVWIGAHAVILDGVVIGEGAVVAAGAVVAESVPPNSVVAGIPARIIKLRSRPAGGE